MQNKADKFEKEKVQKTLSAFFQNRDEVLLAYLLAQWQKTNRTNSAIWI